MFVRSQCSCRFSRTGGSIGSLRALLNDAAISAIQNGEELVDRKVLDMTSTDLAAEEFRDRSPAREPEEKPKPLKQADEE